MNKLKILVFISYKDVPKNFQRHIEWFLLAFGSVIFIHSVYYYSSDEDNQPFSLMIADCLSVVYKVSQLQLRKSEVTIAFVQSNRNLYTRLQDTLKIEGATIIQILKIVIFSFIFLENSFNYIQWKASSNRIAQREKQNCSCCQVA